MNDGYGLTGDVKLIVNWFNELQNRFSFPFHIEMKIDEKKKNMCFIRTLNG